MINSDTSYSRTIAAQVGTDPRYANSIHDDAPAQRLGFRGALVGGTSVTSYMTHLFAEAWGEQWLRHGILSQRSRRPVYEGNTVIATSTPVRTEPEGLFADVVLRDAEGEELANATGGLPNRMPVAPDLARFPHRPHLPVPKAIAAGEHAVGDPFFSTEIVYSQEMHDNYLARVRETLPIYVKDGIAHPGCILVQTMHDATTSYRKPTPGIHVSVTGEHFGIARVGDVLSTSGQIVSVFERKGSHYLEAEQLVIANHRTPIALFRRTSIYAVRQPA